MKKFSSLSFLKSCQTVFVTVLISLLVNNVNAQVSGCVSTATSVTAPACGGTSTISTGAGGKQYYTVPTTTNAYYTVSVSGGSGYTVSPASFTAAGSTQIISVLYGGACTWFSGNGSATLTYTRPSPTASISGGTSPLCYNTAPGTFTCSASAGSGSYTYQWYNASGSISGATSSTYAPGNLTASNSYYCIATSALCTATTTTTAISTYGNLTASISGGTSPICYNTSPGTLAASGSGGTGSYTYQWYNSSGAISGATSSTYTVPSLTASNSYYCAVTSGTCGTVNTSTTSITVYANLSASSSGGTSPICYNTSPGTLTATGSGGTGAYTYQWYNSSGAISGATGSTYIVPSLTANNSYYCAVTSGSCGTVNTSTTSITVYANLSASISGGTSPICYNTSPGTLTATGSGGTGSYTYQWYNSSGAISGATNSTYTVPILTASNSYYCAVTSGTCGTANTTTKAITVYTNLSASISGGSSPICYNTSPGTLTATGGGGTGTYTYQWYNGSGAIIGATSSTYTVPSLTSSNSYYCAVTSGSCGTVNTSTTSITVYSNLSASISGGSSPICYNTSPGTLTASGSGGTGSYTYQWYNRSGAISGATSNTYTVSSLTVNNSYYCAVTSSSCGTVNTSTTAITVYSNLSASISGGTSPICYNTSPGTLTATGSGGTGSYTYQWYNSSGSIGGATSSTYSIPSLNANNSYYCAVTSGSCGTVNTPTKSFTVYNNLAASISGGTTPICNSTSPGTLTATGSGGTGSYTYQWYNSSGAISGATSNTYTVPSLTASDSYYCAITDGSCGTVNTSATSISVYSSLSASISGRTSPICYNTSPGTLTASGSGGTGSYTYQWYNGSGAISGATSSTYTVPNLTANNSYYCAVTSGSCGTVNTSITSITVYSNLSAAISGGTSPICYGSSPGTFTASASGSSGSYTYLWYQNGVSTGVTTQTYSPGALTSTTNFYCAVTDGTCGTLNSNTITTTVNPIPTPSINTSGSNCVGSTFTYSTQSGQSNYIWTIPGTAGTDYNIVSGGSSTDNTLVVSWITPGTYSVTVNYSNTYGCAAIAAGSNTSTFGTAPSSASISTIMDPCNGGYASYITIAGGTSPYTFFLSCSGWYTGPSPVEIDGAGATNCSISSISDANGCAAATTVGNPITFGSRTLTSGNTQSCSVAANSTKVFFDASANLMAKITAGVTALGSTTVVTSIDGSVQQFGAYSPQSYLQRHFQITPTTSAPATVCLYMSDAEVSALNSASASDNHSAPAFYQTFSTTMSNVNITKYHGGTETPSDPTATKTVITSITATHNPTVDGATYNSAWELCFNISSFSGFYIHAANVSSTPLPVTLINFAANAVDNKYIELSWATASELDNTGFQVERSTDGLEYESIGWVEGHGSTTETHNYRFSDLTAVPSVIYYYRLKQIDVDGRFALSQMASASLTGNKGFTIESLVPNPATNQEVSIGVISNVDAPAIVTMTDMLGRVVFHQDWSMSVGYNVNQFDLSGISVGTYLVTVYSNDVKTTKKLVITK